MTPSDSPAALSDRSVTPREDAPAVSGNPPLGRVCVAMVTPFDPDGTIDVESAVRLARALVDGGADSILLSGTTGESPTTHQDEKDRLTCAVVDAVGEKATVVAGACSNDTAHAVRMAEHAQSCGVDALLAVTPYYNRPSQRGIIAHIDAIADATTLPIALYDIPGRTGVALEDTTLDELATRERVVAVKDVTGNVARAMERMERTGLTYYSGDDGLNLGFLTHGAAGVVSVVAHVAPAAYRAMADAVACGDLAHARAIHRQMRPLVDAIMGTGQGAVAAKYAVARLRLIASDTVRLPLVALDARQRATIDAALDAVADQVHGGCSEVGGR